MIIAGLLGGISVGIIGAAVALGVGFGIVGAAFVYVVAGMLGMMIVAAAVALCPTRRASDGFGAPDKAG